MLYFKVRLHGAFKLIDLSLNIFQDGGGEENDIDASRSKKRRERRQRLQKQFDLMKTGNFWKINEMQKEKFIGK